MTEKRKVERRNPKPEFLPRQFQRRGRVFFYLRRVYLTDTNAFANVYFAQYFDFMGEAREELLKYVYGKNVEVLMTSGLVLVTVKTGIEYKNPCYLFDEIKIEITLKALSKMKIQFNYRFWNETRNQLAATGDMTIATTFGNKIVPIPEMMTLGLKDLFIAGNAVKNR